MNIGSYMKSKMTSAYFPKENREIRAKFKSQLEQGTGNGRANAATAEKNQPVPVAESEFDQQVDAMVFVPKHQSQGTETLTDDQIKDLKSRYHVKDMTDRELRSLMLELNDMGVISTKDAISSQRMEVKVNFNDLQVALVTEDSLDYDYSNKLAYFTKLAKLDKQEGNSMEESHANIARILELLA